MKDEKMNPNSPRDEMLQIVGDLKRRLSLQMPEIPWCDVVQEDAERGGKSMAAVDHTLERATTLDEVRAILGDCTRCRLHEKRQKIVFGQGNPDARLMFVGEGPGADEDRQGLAFVGRAGQLLTKIIAAIGLSREEVFIANIVKCRPPGNRDPQEDEIRECIPFLKAQINVIRPKIICTLGAPASKTRPPRRSQNCAAGSTTWTGLL